MYQSMWNSFSGNPAALAGIVGPWLIVIILWTLVWKGLALWRAARKNSPIWFVVLLVVNTVGILEILYYFIFSKMGGGEAMHKKEEIEK